MVWIVRMPKLGQMMETGTLQQWIKGEGDEIQQGEAVAVIESDKFTEEIEAREGGVLRKVLVPEGAEVPSGAPIGIIAAANEALPSVEVSGVPSAPEQRAGAEETPTPTRSFRGRAKSSPAAKKLAQTLDVDLAQISGTGVEGAITKEDVQKHVELAAPLPVPCLTFSEVRDLSAIRRTIAERLGQSYREAVHVTLNKKIDVRALVEVRQQLNQQLEAKLSLVDFLLLGLVRTLEQHPEFNALFEEERHKLVVEKNIGLAFDAERGLMTPVLHNAGDKDLFALAQARRDLAQKAEQDAFVPENFEAGTFTLSNLGPLGIDAFTPVINPPQIAILGVGAVREEAIRDERGQVDFSPFITFSLSFDHRVVDGSDAARFLSTFKMQLNAPIGLLV